MGSKLESATMKKKEMHREHLHEDWQSCQDRQQHGHEEGGYYKEEWFPKHLPHNQGDGEDESNQYIVSMEDTIMNPH